MKPTTGRRSAAVLPAPKNVRTAISASYDPSTQRVVLELDNNVRVAFPRARVRGLEGADLEQISNLAVVNGGSAIEWPDLIADFCVLEMLPELLGIGANAPTIRAPRAAPKRAGSKKRRKNSGAAA
jgi:Protein of unknown function (DUF2442)